MTMRPIAAAPLAGRVYVGPDPERGPHPGYRGPLRVDVLGVHLDEDCEWLSITAPRAALGGWPESEWVPVQKAALLPWSQITLIEWETSDVR